MKMPAGTIIILLWMTFLACRAQSSQVSPGSLCGNPYGSRRWMIVGNRFECKKCRVNQYWSRMDQRCMECTGSLTNLKPSTRSRCKDERPRGLNGPQNFSTDKAAKPGSNNLSISCCENTTVLLEKSTKELVKGIGQSEHTKSPNSTEAVIHQNVTEDKEFQEKAANNQDSTETNPANPASMNSVFPDYVTPGTAIDKQPLGGNVEHEKERAKEDSSLPPQASVIITVLGTLVVILLTALIIVFFFFRRYVKKSRQEKLAKITNQDLETGMNLNDALLTQED